MNHAQVKAVADKHSQKYDDSCSPSAVELILKVHGLVGEDYYELQNKYQNDNIGFEPFAGQELFGVRFTEHHDDPPFIRLRGEIGMEHGAGRCVIVSTFEPHGKAHVWLATEPVIYGAQAISKHFSTTLEIDIFRDRLDILQHAHYLTYELPQNVIQQNGTGKGGSVPARTQPDKPAARGL